MELESFDHVSLSSGVDSVPAVNDLVWVDGQSSIEEQQPLHGFLVDLSEKLGTVDKLHVLVVVLVHLDLDYFYGIFTLLLHGLVNKLPLLRQVFFVLVFFQVQHLLLKRSAYLEISGELQVVWRSVFVTCVARVICGDSA